MLRLLPFALASFGPALLLGAGTLWGGLWAGLGIVAMTVVVFFLDKLPIVRPAFEATGHRMSEALGVMHFVLLGLAVWSMGGPLPTLDKVLIVAGCGLYFGQISNSNAHELIHRTDRWAFRLGAANYIALLFGHHTSAHRLVHHVHAATPRDPATAAKGVGFWAYAVRAWLGGFKDGLKAERQRHGDVRWPAPYIGYVLGAFIAVILASFLAGAPGVIGLITIAIYAQLQLLLSDYVQHYGLERPVMSGGRRAPMGPAHSWNAPHWYSSAMMLNAPRHSEHHTRPDKPFPALGLDAETMPMLPRSLPVMAVVALIPPLWRKVMDTRVTAWRQTHASAPAT